MTAIEDYSLICDQGRRFDLSQKGTLLLIKHGVKSDYDQKELWQARRHVLQHGLFNEVLEQIIQRMPQRNLTYIDVGCVEETPLLEFGNNTVNSMIKQLDLIFQRMRLTW